MLSTRLIASVPLVLAALFAFFWPGWPGALCFGLLAAAFMVAAVLELSALTAAMGCGVPAGRGVIFGLLLLVSAAFSRRYGLYGATAMHAWDALIVVGYMLAAFSGLFRHGPDRDALVRRFVGIGVFMYVCWALSFVAKLYFEAGLAPAGRYLAFYLIAVTKLTDVGAFAVGTLTARRAGGNHKLAPALSPKKSWEGLAGGLVAGAVAAVVLLLLLPGGLQFAGVRVLGFRGAVLFGVLVALLGLAGDLAESVLKRVAGVKDSGRLPGLGGVLDVMDSLMFTAPVFYCYVRLVQVGALAP